MQCGSSSDAMECCLDARATATGESPETRASAEPVRRHTLGFFFFEAPFSVRNRSATGERPRGQERRQDFTSSPKRPVPLPHQPALTLQDQPTLLSRLARFTPLSTAITRSSRLDTLTRRRPRVLDIPCDGASLRSRIAQQGPLRLDQP